MSDHASTSYWDYIKVEELLALQTGLESSDENLSNDEVMFITIHQIDELWFKLILRELVTTRDLFAQPVVPEQSLAAAVRSIRRMQELLVHLTSHFTLMETMTTRDYLDFRDKLGSASGFQSGQMREIEIMLGLEEHERVVLGGGASYLDALRDATGAPSSAYHRVQMRLADKPSLAGAIREWLYRTPIQGSIPGQTNDEKIVATFIDEYAAAHEKVTRAALESRADGAAVQVRDRYEKEIAATHSFLRADDAGVESRTRASRIRAALVFIESYRELPLLAWPREVIDAIVAFEQSFVVFRQRHARMVERVIGRRTGTGGSSGVDYLDATALKYRVFREVWAVRTLLLRKGDLPALRHPEIYGFAHQAP